MPGPKSGQPLRRLTTTSLEQLAQHQVQREEQSTGKDGENALTSYETYF